MCSCNKNMVSADGTICALSKTNSCCFVFKFFIALHIQLLVNKVIPVGIKSSPAGSARHLFEAPTQMKIKYSYEENKMGLQQAVFNKQGAKLAFSCPPKVLTLLLQTQKRQAWEQILLSTLAITYSTGILECGKLVWQQNSTRLATRKSLTQNSWNVHGRFFATSGCLCVCKKTRLLWKYPKLGNYPSCNSLGWETWV